MERKLSWPLLSISIDSSSRHWTALACDCWMELAWEAPQASTSLMAMEQWVSASWIDWAQMAFASLIDFMVSESFWWRPMENSKTNFCWGASMEDFIASRSPRALLASSWRWAASGGGASLLDPGASIVGEEGVGISSREASSISALLGVFTWDDMSTGWGKSSGLVGKGVTRTIGSCLFGVELPDMCSDVSKTAQDRSSLTSVVMLTSPSAFGGGSLTGLAIRMEKEWLLRGRALSSGPSMMDCGMSTLGKWVCLWVGWCLWPVTQVGRLSQGPHTHWALLGRLPGNLSWGAGRPLVDWLPQVVPLVPPFGRMLRCPYLGSGTWWVSPLSCTKA